MDNIYPDKSNDKFDIQYAPLLGLSSDIRASFGLAEDGGSPVIKTPDDNSTGHLRFGVAAEDAVAIQNRSFDLNGAYSFQLTQLGNKQFLVDPPNGLYQLGAIPVPGSDSGLSYTYLEIDDTDKKIILQAPEGIVLPGYGYGNHSGTYTKFLAVDAGGNMIEVDAVGGGSGTVTNFSFTDANGFDGTVTNSTTTPNLTLTTTLTQGSIFFAGAAGAINEDNSNFFFDNTNNILGIGINSSFGSSRLHIVDNAVAGDPIVLISSTSTAASGNGQIGIRAVLTGANSNGGESTYAGQFANGHTGGGTNIGCYGSADGGSLNYGVYGSGTTNGVRGVSDVTGVEGNTTQVDGIGVYGENSGGGVAVRGLSYDGRGGEFQAHNQSTANTINEVLRLVKTAGSGGGADGIGLSVDFYLQTSAGVGNIDIASKIISKYTTANAGTRNSSLIFQGVLSASTVDLLTLAGDGSVKLRPITAAAASAITPAEGMMLFTSDTDATFITVGFWGYQGGLWVKL